LGGVYGVELTGLEEEMNGEGKTRGEKRSFTYRVSWTRRESN